MSDIFDDALSATRCAVDIMTKRGAEQMTNDSKFIPLAEQNHAPEVPQTKRESMEEWIARCKKENEEKKSWPVQ